MRIHKNFLIAFVYMFLNSVGLPYGLLYTTIASPLFYGWLLLKGKRWIIARFAILILPFVVVHLIHGVEPLSYFRSVLLLCLIFIFVYAFTYFLKHTGSLQILFKNLTITNFCFTLLAIGLLFTPQRSLAWTSWNFAADQGTFKGLYRLTMLTYEPSYYATLLVPLFGFYFIKYILKQFVTNGFWQLMLAVVPLLLSLSFGVISGLLLSIAILFTINISLFLTRKTLFYSLIALAFFVFVVFLVLLIFYPENPLFIRALAFLQGDDQSGRGRTSEAFYLAHLIAKEKSLLWGIGPGQLKIIGDPIIRSFYRYPSTYGQVSIPNSFAETIALFGYIGAGLRLFVELYFFNRTRVLNNYFRTLMFFYIFIYQFTGSFVTNSAEYVIWALAFCNCFPQFDKAKPITQ